VSLNVSEEAALPLSAELARQINEASALQPIRTTPETPEKSATPAEKAVGKLLSGTAKDYEATMERLSKRIVRSSSGSAGESSDLLGFMLAGIFWGAVSLITPCVFPMNPITVSFFLKQSEKEHHRPIRMALIYSATIVVVLTLAAAFLLSVFRFLS